MFEIYSQKPGEDREEIKLPPETRELIEYVATVADIDEVAAFKALLAFTFTLCREGMIERGIEGMIERVEQFANDE